MNVRALPSRRDLAKTLEATLIEAARERKARPEVITDPDTGQPELEWVLHERAVMLAAVNTIRDREGWPHLTAADLLRPETSATGHIDYTTKYALYAAELALTPPQILTS